MIQAPTAGGYALFQGRLQDELALQNSTLVADLAATCATTPDAFSAAVRRASVLDACRRTDPGVTLDALVARMGARVGSRLQMPVTMGVISAGDAARLSADTRDHLRASLAAAPAPMRLDG